MLVGAGSVAIERVLGQGGAQMSRRFLRLLGAAEGAAQSGLGAGQVRPGPDALGIVRQLARQVAEDMMQPPA